MEDLNKLPAWAREKIRLLELRLKESNAKLDLFENQPDSPVSISNYCLDKRGRVESDFKLPADRHYKFQLGTERWEEFVEVGLEKDGKTLEIRAGGTIQIIPGSSNHCRIRMGKW